MERKFKIKNFLFLILSYFFNNKSFFVKNFKKKRVPSRFMLDLQKSYF